MAGGLRRRVTAISLPAGPVIGHGGAVTELAQDAAAGLIQVPDAHVAAVPCPGCVPLVGRARVAVVHVEIRVDGAGDAGELNPGLQLARGCCVALDLVIDLGRSVGCGEEDVPAVGLGVGGELRIRWQAYQDGVVRQVGGHLGRVDREQLSISPVGVVPVPRTGGQRVEVQIRRVLAGGDRGVVPARGIAEVGVPVGVLPRRIECLARGARAQDHGHDLPGRGDAGSLLGAQRLEEGRWRRLVVVLRGNPIVGSIDAGSADFIQKAEIGVTGVAVSVSADLQGRPQAVVDRSRVRIAVHLDAVDEKAHPGCILSADDVVGIAVNHIDAGGSHVDPARSVVLVEEDLAAHPDSQGIAVAPADDLAVMGGRPVDVDPGRHGELSGGIRVRRT